MAANNLAWMLAEDGRLDDALRWATVATGEMTGRPGPHDTLGWIRLKMKQPVEALASFELALRRLRLRTRSTRITSRPLGLRSV